MGGERAIKKIKRKRGAQTEPKYYIYYYKRIPPPYKKIHIERIKALILLSGYCYSNRVHQLQIKRWG
jgi:hypothetical protein